MATIIDKTNVKSRSAPNRKAFIDRHRDVLKEHVDRLANAKSRSIKDISKKRTITINKKTIDEPRIDYDRTTGSNEGIYTGNDQFVNGDKIPVDKKGGGGGNGGAGNSSENSEDEFSFTLTKEEFLDIYLGNCGLPDMVKESLNRLQFTKLKRAGYSKEGSPCQLDVKKTFENAIARRIATKNDNETPAFLDDIDLRYRHFKEEVKPSKDAVMFCVMDVSASMTETMKEWAKKFFILLYLFLEREYKDITVIFIRHTTEAWEVDEQEFFYGKQSGGTQISSAYNLIDKIIKERYADDMTNLYIAQASDGDNWTGDNEVTSEVLLGSVLKHIQYLAYIEITDVRFVSRNSWLSYMRSMLTPTYKNIQGRQVCHEKDIFEVFQDLFKKRQP